MPHISTTDSKKHRQLKFNVLACVGGQQRELDVGTLVVIRKELPYSLSLVSPVDETGNIEPFEFTVPVSDLDDHISSPKKEFYAV